MNEVDWTLGAIDLHKSDGYFWIRIFGCGIHLVDRSKHKPLFSIRNGYIKEYKVGKYGFKFLRSGK